MYKEYQNVNITIHDALYDKSSEFRDILDFKFRNFKIHFLLNQFHALIQTHSAYKSYIESLNEGLNEEFTDEVSGSKRVKYVISKMFRADGSIN